jgi:hypothetical protein
MPAPFVAEAVADLPNRLVRTGRVRVRWVMPPILLALVGLPLSASAKLLNRAVVIGSDGRVVEVTGAERDFEGLARDSRAEPRPVRGGYLRLFFVGPGDFPANPARYYPGLRCIALDWPTYEQTCRRVHPSLERLFRRAHALPRFDARPTVLARVTYSGTFSGPLKTMGALSGPVELALSRVGRVAPKPRRCYAFSGGWRGPAAALRPRRFFLCSGGVYSSGRLYPMRRGVWSWFQLNVRPR